MHISKHDLCCSVHILCPSLPLYLKMISLRSQGIPMNNMSVGGGDQSDNKREVVLRSCFLTHTRVCVCV